MSNRDRGLSREQVLKQIDASLARLRVDYVDLYQCHRYDTETPLEETMGALTEVVRAGKARYLGFSEWSAAQIRASLELPGVERFVSSQPQYSLLHRDPEREVFAVCAANGISQIVWSPLAQGVLTGKYSPGEAPPEDTRATSASMGSFIQRWLRDDVLEAVQRLRPIVGGLGITLSQLALAWVLSRGDDVVPIPGTKRRTYLEENAAALEVELSDDDVVRLERAFPPGVASGDRYPDMSTVNR
jgi:1-deoxyxylulose-5-phosphate synthase